MPKFGTDRIDRVDRPRARENTFPPLRVSVRRASQRSLYVKLNKRGNCISGCRVQRASQLGQKDAAAGIYFGLGRYDKAAPRLLLRGTIHVSNEITRG